MLWGLLSWWPQVECMPLQVAWNHSLSHQLFCFIFCLLSTERRWMLSPGLSPAKPWRVCPEINMVIFLSALLVPVEVNFFLILLEYSAVKRKRSSHLSFCTLTPHAYFLWTPSMEMALSPEGSQRHTVPFPRLLQHLCPTLLQKSSELPVWQREQRPTQCYLCISLPSSSIYLTFFFTGYFFRWICVMPVIKAGSSFLPPHDILSVNDHGGVQLSEHIPIRCLYETKKSQATSLSDFHQMVLRSKWAKNSKFYVL